MPIDTRVFELVRRWEEQQEHGQQPLSPEELCADSPELLDEVKRRIQDLQDLEPVLDAPQVGEQPGRAPRPDEAESATTETAAAGRYRPVQFHAKGGLGEVLRAEDSELHREVALKRIQPRHAHDPASRHRFVQEAEITARLEHPGIVPVYGMVTDDDGQPCYAMRFIEGPTLGDAIQEFHEADKIPGRDPGEHSLALRKLLGHFIAVCNTIAYAHSRGIIHRDLKPGNIMLGKYGETLVVDWGLAKSFERTEAERASGEQTLAPTSETNPEGATLPGQARGTPAFMSPEQAEGRQDEMGPASDVFSLGATLYTLLTGQPPYPGDIYKALQKARRGEFPPPRQVKAAIAQGLEAVCLKAMALMPEERYASAKEMADEVEKWLAENDERWERAEHLAVQAKFDLAYYRYGGNPDAAMAACAHLLESAVRLKDRAPEHSLRTFLGAWHDQASRQVFVHDGPVNAAFSPDGKRLVTESGGTARLWDSATGKPLGPPLQHQGAVDPAAFSPDGKSVVTASGKTARLWDSATGKPLGLSLEHEGEVNAATFSPDGQSIVTASSDGTARLWDSATGKPLGPPLQHQREVRAAAFSPDGKSVVTASSDKTARLWKAPRPLQGTPEHILLWCEVRTGLTLD